MMFRAMAYGVWKLLQIKIIFTNLTIKWEALMRLYSHNKFAINIVHNPTQYDRIKHMEVDCHFIDEKLDRQLMCTPSTCTKNQLAEILAKGLATHSF